MTSNLIAEDVEITGANIVYEINKFGGVHVLEEITYMLHNCENNPFKELYTEKPPGLNIINPKGHCINTKCIFRYENSDKSYSGGNELILTLTDKKCGEIQVKYEYDVYPIVIAKDTVQFYYKLWGDKSGPANINVKIITPEEVITEIIEYDSIETEVKELGAEESKNITKDILKKNETIKNVIYFIHKNNNLYNVHEYGRTIEINSVQSNNEMLEINLLMPKEWFIENNNYIYRKDLSKSEIISTEERDMIIRQNMEIINIIITFLFFLYLLFPFIIIVIIYHLYGKELSPDAVNYNAIYEREIPSVHTPAEVIFFIKGDHIYSEKEKANAIVATIMSFVNKDIATIEERDKQVYLKFDYNKITSDNTREYEKDFLNFIRKEFGSKEFSIKEFEKQTANKLEYYQVINKFFLSINKYLNRKNEYIKNKGNMVGQGLIGIYVLISFLLMFIVPYVIFGLFFAIFASIIIKSKKIVLAKWTPKGRVLNLKWENFRKFITDYSLMKEHPPESVKLWDEYLTYAIALGVASKTINVMKKIAPPEINVNTHSVSHIYITSAMALRMGRTFSPTYISKSGYTSGSGGYSGMSGGFGGGMGGGGFGGRR